MTRPRKQTVDYFPHSTSHKRTMDIIERRFGVHGYAFWFKLLEVLGSSDGHSFDINDVDNWEYLTAKAFVDDETGRAILDKLAALKAIDQKLYNNGIIWCQNFVDNLAPLYEKRVEETPSPPVSGDGNEVSGGRKPHRIGKDSKGKDKKIYGARFTPPNHDEVKAYFLEKGINSGEPERFMDHHIARGWILSNGRKMKDWKAAVRTWISNIDKFKPRGAGHGQAGPRTYKQELAEGYLREKVKKSCNSGTGGNSSEGLGGQVQPAEDSSGVSEFDINVSGRPAVRRIIR